MGGMMRLKDEKELEELLRRTRLRVAGSRRAPAPTAPKPAPTPAPAATPPRIATSARRKGGERSDIEIDLQRQIEADPWLPTPEYDTPYLIGSRHRMDVLWRERRCGVEVQGHVHRIKGRFKADMEKRALSLLQGWAILEVGGDEIRSGKAIEWIRALLNMHPPR